MKGKSKGLNAKEKKALQEHETIIGQYELGFLAVGRALTAIRDQRLYRADYRDFDSYLSERWDMICRRAYQLIDAASVVDDLCTMVHKKSPNGDKVLPMGDILPVNERQARPLAPLNTEERREIWARVLEAAADAPRGRVTAALVSSVVDAYLEASGRGASDPGGGDDVFGRIKEIKKMLKRMESRPELARFCKQTEAKLKKLIEQVEKTYMAAMKEYLGE